MGEVRRVSDPNLPFGTDICRCSVCSEYFNSAYAFDAHRIGKAGVDRRCKSVAEMIESGMSLNAKRRWITQRRIVGDAIASEARVG